MHIYAIMYIDNFNSHAHVERDIVHKRTAARPSYFNSHAHVERDVGGLITL